MKCNKHCPTQDVIENLLQLEKSEQEKKKKEGRTERRKKRVMENGTKRCIEENSRV